MNTSLKGSGLKGAAAIAVSVFALAVASAGGAQAQPSESTRNSAQVRATAIPGKHAYERSVDALLAADLDDILSRARNAGPGDPPGPAEGAVLVMDELAAGRPSSARARLDTLPERYRGGARSLLEPWLSLAEGDKNTAQALARTGQDDLPGRLGPLLPALLSETSGDLAGADAAYDRLIATLDTKPPGEDEPASMEEALGNLLASQTTQILYRAALVKHRLGKKEEARATYALVEGFAPNSPDTAINIARLERGEPPMEPPLDYVRGLARWSLFLSEEFGRSEGLAQVLSDPVRKEGLVSPSSALFAQMGIALDPSATDWALGSGYTLLEADGVAGAERIFRRIPANSAYGPDAAIGLAEVALKRGDESRAAAEARRALQISGDRWTIALSAASVLTRANKEAPALAAFDTALARAKTGRNKADILIARASANNFFGRQDNAVADGRAAIAADDRAAIKIAVIGYLMEHPDGWTEAVRLGRQLLAEKPDSVARLNQLGYTLIHRPEGLEEGYRLLTRGVALGETDFAVIDSLGWAYYLYGDFDEARRLIERANELSPEPVAEILDHLGDIAWRQDRQDDAREAWRKALDAKPEARRRVSLTEKIAKGLTTPAPERRTPPVVEPLKPGQRSDT